MKTWFWIWTVVCLVLAAGIAWVAGRDRNYTGTNIDLVTDADEILKINSDSLTIEAASDHFFALRSLEGQGIVGSSTEKPIGWEGEEYFKLDPTQTRGGEWIVENGKKISLNLSSSDSIAVVVSLKPIPILIEVIFGLVCAGALWLAIIVLAKATIEDR